MRRSKYRRASSPTWFSGRRRIIAVAATLVAFGGIVTVTQVSNASTDRTTKRALAACDDLAAPNQVDLSTETRRGTYTTNNGRVTQHADDGAGDVATAAEVRARCRTWVMNNVANEEGAVEATTQARRRGNGGGNNNGGNNNGGNNGGNNNGGNPSAVPSEEASQPAEEETTAPPAGEESQPPAEEETTAPPAEETQPPAEEETEQPAPQPTQGQTTPPPGAGLGILTNSCETSDLEAHDGFQKGNRCVSTEFGEVGAAANNPTLLITRAPRQVNVNTPFTLQVSTRNLIRDRFLAAGQGGYYVESSVLQGGLVRGHFHTACRILQSQNQAPAPDPVPAFFVATEDSRGGATPDTVSIQVPGLPEAGTFQCSSWAGDGSHRTPMMERANQTPAFDSVRIRVRG
ncbi:Pecanex-like protein 1 [Actinoplanes sp. NPDC023936]|uniref:Pecanex-like protein 1 n=1 Tax=Actinoplanes sp. NPDC023936 TaxID=3154910 RepID=UPI0033EC8AFA